MGDASISIDNKMFFVMHDIYMENVANYFSYKIKSDNINDHTNFYGDYLVANLHIWPTNEIDNSGETFYYRIQKDDIIVYMMNNKHTWKTLYQGNIIDFINNYSNFNQ